jgi:signal transduction histidine kinase
MLDTPTGLQKPPLDSSRSALDLVHRLLILPSEEHTKLDGLLDELTTAFGATTAGLATFPEGAPLCYQSSSPGGSRNEAFPPWRDQPDVIERLPHTHTALTLARDAGGSCLLTLLGTLEHGSWVLWLEAEDRSPWSDSEAALLQMVGQALSHRLVRDETPTPWAVQLDRSIRRQRMDAAARVVRRLSHDFGNILTGILGFSELALAHPAASDSPLYDFLSEVHRGAQSGTQYTDQLRLFARRQTAITRSSSLASVLAEFSREWRTAAPVDFRLELNLPDDLPPIAVEAASLRQVLAVVLENAREAIVGAGVIDVSAQSIQLDAGEASKLIGDVRPGTHLEIRIADRGNGLTPEARRQLFAEPFFSTKPRKRGFGLATAYGILSAHRGGMELLSRPEGGTIARLVVPVAAVAALSF